jgi:hypothetical protein
MTDRKMIGVQRIADDGSIDQRCNNCVDFYAAAEPVFAGQPLDCTYCGQQWAGKSELRNELDALDRRYCDGAMTWSDFTAGMRSLYRRATLANDADVTARIADWADSFDDSAEYPHLLAGALDGLTATYVIEKVTASGQTKEVARGKAPARDNYDAVSDEASEVMPAIVKAAPKRTATDRRAWLNARDEDNAAALNKAHAAREHTFGERYAEAYLDLVSAFEDRQPREFDGAPFRIRFEYASA